MNTIPKILSGGFVFRQNLSNQVEQALIQTSELREQISSRLHLIENEDGQHAFTAKSLGHSLTRLGQYDEVNALTRNARQNGSIADISTTSVLDEFVQRSELAHGDFQAARKHFQGEGKKADHALYRFIDIANFHGDLDEVVEVLSEQPLELGRLYGGCVYLAIIAHWIERPDIVDFALKRMRATCENSEFISDRPLGEQVEWLADKDNYMAGTFVDTLACCGHGELAERLWLEFDFEWQSYEFYTVARVCNLLALCGDRSRARRIAKLEFPDGVPEFLSLIFNITSIRAKEAIEENNAQFLATIGEGCILQDFDGSLTDWEKIQSAGYQLANRIECIVTLLQKSPTVEQIQLGNDAIQVYLDLTDPILHQYKEHNEEGQPLSIVITIIQNDLTFFRVADVISKDNLDRLVNRQLPYLENKAIAHLKSYDIRNRNQLLAKLGLLSIDATQMILSDRIELLQSWLKTDDSKAAREVFKSAIEEALQVDYNQCWSGSVGGRGVNTATANRYRVAMLCGQFDRLADGINIINKIDHVGERIDGFRCLASSYAPRIDIKVAMQWAVALEDENHQLAALVGILDSVAAKIPIEESLSSNSNWNQLRHLGIQTGGGC